MTAIRFGLLLVAISLGHGLTAQEGAAPKVAIAAAYTAEITDEAQFIGRGEAIDRVDILARVSGFLQDIHAIDGAIVKAGDPLYSIERDSYEAAVSAAEASVAQAQAELSLAQIELKRKQELFNRGTTPESELDLALANEKVAEAHVAAAQAQLRQAELDLSYTTVTAPFDGRIGRSSVSAGELVSSTSGALVTLVRTAPVYITFSITEKDLLEIMNAAQRDRIRTEENYDQAPPVLVTMPGGETLDETGQIVFLDNRVDPATGTIAIRAQFENNDRKIFDGSFVNVSIQAPTPRTALLIPQAAVQRDQRGDFVLLVNSEQLVEQRYIETGVAEGAAITVNDGLVEGDSVIVEGLQRVRPGVAVDAVLTGTRSE